VSRSDAPEVSVVVATRDRPELLGRLLGALRAQTLGRDRFEVLVVDDGSGPAVQAILDAAASTGGLDLHVVRRDGGGPAAARNVGWRGARAQLIAFTDDDCEPSPAWLEAGLRAWDGNGRRFVQGRTLPAGGVPVNDLSPFQHSIEVAEATPEVETCNVFYPRTALDAVGGFEESIRTGEDMELAWSARELGFEPRFAPDALVEHAIVDVTPAQSLRKVWAWSDAMRPFARHPGLRRTRLMKRVFWNWSHYLIARALLAVPFTRRRLTWPVALLLAWPLVAFEYRKARQTGGVHLAAFWLLRDLVEMAAVIRGAVRYRTLVL